MKCVKCMHRQVNWLMYILAMFYNVLYAGFLPGFGRQAGFFWILGYQNSTKMSEN